MKNNLYKWVTVLAIVLGSSTELLQAKTSEPQMQDGYKLEAFLAEQRKHYHWEPKQTPIEAVPEPKPTSDPEPESTPAPEPRKLKMKATAYTISKSQTGNTKGITYLGTKAQKHHTVSVDPHVIPLGSLLYIESGTQYDGYYVAEDTGSAIKGKILDVFMGWGEGTQDWEDAMDFGKRTVTVTIIREGKEQ